MSSFNRSDLIKIKRFKESKREFDRKLQMALWFYLAAGLLLLAALLLDNQQPMAQGALALCALICLAPTLRTRSVAKLVAFIEQNHDACMKQNNISRYSLKTGAFLLRQDDLEADEKFHDPNCEECWDDNGALFNLDEHRQLQQADGSTVRLPRQSASQLDLMTYYWERISVNTAFKLYVSVGQKNVAAAFNQAGG